MPRPTNALSTHCHDHPTKTGNAAAQRWVQQNSQRKAQLSRLPLVPGGAIQTVREGNDVRDAQRLILRRFPGLLNAGMPALSPAFRSQVHALASDDYDAHLRAREIENTQGVNEDQVDATDDQPGGIYLRGERARTAPHPFNVTLIHEILHTLENSGLATADMMEGMTQYLAVYVVDGHVT
jgi:hypothetical protein